MDIIEGNKLIADFLSGMKLEPFSEYHYHDNWQRLMPVVEKIWKMKFLTSLNFYTANGFNFSCEMKIYRNGIGESEIEAETPNPIETVWQTVVQFIEWYNETKLINHG